MVLSPLFSDKNSKRSPLQRWTILVRWWGSLQRKEKSTIQGCTPSMPSTPRPGQVSPLCLLYAMELCVFMSTKATIRWHLTAPQTSHSRPPLWAVLLIPTTFLPLECRSQDPSNNAIIGTAGALVVITFWGVSPSHPSIHTILLLLFQGQNIKLVLFKKRLLEFPTCL